MEMYVVDGEKIVKLDQYPDLPKIERTGNMWWKGEWRPVIDVHRQWVYVDGKKSHLKGFQIELSEPWDPFCRSHNPKKEAVHA
jgi:hypothetical protein